MLNLSIGNVREQEIWMTDWKDWESGISECFWLFLAEKALFLQYVVGTREPWKGWNILWLRHSLLTDCACGEQSLFRSLRIRLPGIRRGKACFVPDRLCCRLVHFIQKSGINYEKFMPPWNRSNLSYRFLFVFSASKFDVEPVYIQKIFFIKCLPRGEGYGVGHAGEAGFNISRRVRRSRSLGCGG